MENNLSPDFEQTICFCHNVSRGKIKQEIAAGAKTIEEIQEKTLASTGCGGCRLDVEQILSEVLAGPS